MYHGAMCPFSVDVGVGLGVWHRTIPGFRLMCSCHAHMSPARKGCGDSGVPGGRAGDQKGACPIERILMAGTCHREDHAHLGGGHDHWEDHAHLGEGYAHPQL